MPYGYRWWLKSLVEETRLFFYNLEMRVYAPLILFLLLNPPLFASAMNLKVTSPTFDYSIIQNKGKFEYRNQGKIYSYNIKKCNKTLFKNFWEQFEFKMNHSSLQTPSTNVVALKPADQFTVHYNSKKINTPTVGVFGRYLANLPEDVRALKLALRFRCEK